MSPHLTSAEVLAAQAARRRRVQGRTPPSGSTTSSLPVARSSSNAAVAASGSRQPTQSSRQVQRTAEQTPNTGRVGAAEAVVGDALLDRSMEVGEEVQSLLASVRKTVKGTTTRKTIEAVVERLPYQEKAAIAKKPAAAATKKPQDERIYQHQPPILSQRASAGGSRITQSVAASVTKKSAEVQPSSYYRTTATTTTTTAEISRKQPDAPPTRLTSGDALLQQDLPSATHQSRSVAKPPFSSTNAQEDLPTASSRTAASLSTFTARDDAVSDKPGPHETRDVTFASSPQKMKYSQQTTTPANTIKKPAPSNNNTMTSHQTTPVKTMTNSGSTTTNKNAPQTAPKSALKKRNVAPVRPHSQALLKQAESIVYDAACFKDHALVMVQSFVNTKTVSAAVDSDKDWVTAKIDDGKGLGQKIEVLELAIRGGYRDSNRPLSFGDRITLRNSDSKLLGVRRSSTDENDPVAADRTTFQVGFFSRSSSSSSNGSKAQQWIVFPANETVKVGHAALEETIKTKALPVQSGQAVVLRNCQTGGILSCYDNVLKLVTDAHLQPVVADPDPDEEVVNPEGVPSLMTRLQRSDKLVPSLNDMFCFRQSASPVTPLWISKRRFMDGSYLWQPNRHEPPLTTEKMERMLFGGNKSDCDQVDLEACTREQMQTPRGQEAVLVDELVGACMGLEGEYIKADVATVDTWGIQFVLSGAQFDVLLRQIVEEMLPLPTSFARIRRFVLQHTPGYEYGSVMQALCAALGRLLESYVGTVISWQKQFRQDDLSIRDLHVLGHSSMHSLSILEQACKAVRDKKGGALINALRRLKLQKYEGDTVADDLIHKLLIAAAEPFMKRLSVWLENGVLLDDPHEEFMIQKSKAEPWESKYEILNENVLEGLFSTEQTVERVLAAGRYWNAVRSCSKDNNLVNDPPSRKDKKTTVLDLNYGTSTANVSSSVQTMYQEASKALVSLLLANDQYDLIDSLRLVKRFFLLEYGDFFVNFLDKAENELLKDVSHLSRNRIQHWMNSLLQFSDHEAGESDGPLDTTANHSRSKVKPTGLKCRFSTTGLTDHLDTLHAASGGIDTHEAWTPMRHAYGGGVGSSDGELTGLDTFFLDFATIPFPISLVISPGAMECYQLLFRHLFFAKYVERRLVSIWKDHQAMKELQELRGLLGPTFLLRQRMLHFLQNLIYYMMFEVLEPNWVVLESSIGSPRSRKEQTVDDILRDHSMFLHRVLEACLLTNRDVIRALTKLLKTCLLFSEQMKRFMKATKFDDDRNIVATEMQNVVQRNLNERGGSRASGVSAKYLRESIKHTRAERVKRVQRQTARVRREVSSDSYQRMITRFEEVFSENLREFMVQLTNSDDSFHSLCIRLDYNGFSSSSLGLT